MILVVGIRVDHDLTVRTSPAGILRPGTKPRSSFCIISNEFFPHRGGIAVYAEEVARATASRGNYVEVWAPAHPSAIHRSWPFRLRPVRFEGTQNLSCQLRLALAMIEDRRTLRRSTVHLPDPGAMLAMTYLLPFRAFKPGRLVLSFHGSEIQRFAEVSTLRLLIRRLIRRADRVAVLSRFTQRVLLESFPNAASKIAIAPVGVREVVRTARASVSKPPGKLVVLTVARIHPRKGQAHVISALDRLPETLRSQVEYWIVGDGNKEGYGAHLHRLAASSGVKVRFFCEVPDDHLGMYYAAADVFALTSVNHQYSVEGFGLVYLEAGAHGLPCVAYDVGGAADAVCHGRTGFVVPEEDQGALSLAFERLLRDPALRARLGAAGREWSAQHTWARTVERLFDFTEALRAPPEPLLQQGGSIVLAGDS